jgi:hypothetical protein
MGESAIQVRGLLLVQEHWGLQGKAYPGHGVAPLLRRIAGCGAHVVGWRQLSRVPQSAAALPAMRNKATIESLIR